MISSRIYALSLRWLPRHVRVPFAVEMQAAFDALIRDERARGGVAAVAALTVRAVFDVLRTAAVERVRRLIPALDPLAEAFEPEGAGPLTGGEGMWWSDLISDLKFAVRTFRKTPGLVVVLVATLGLGIGANTAIFSVLDGVLLEPLPYDEPHELAVVQHRATEAENVVQGLSGPDLQDYLRLSKTFVGFAGMGAAGTNLTGDGPAQRVILSWVSPGFFELFGVDAEVGRILLPSDQVITDRAVITRPGFSPPPVGVVLSYGLWQRRFGADRGVIGRSLEVNGQAMNVVGVMPADFRILLPPGAPIPSDVDLWTHFPIALGDSNRNGTGLAVLGRLAPGVTLEEAQEEMTALSARLREQHEVHALRGTTAEVLSLHDQVVGPVGRTLWILFGAVGLVLVIACANVASLLLVRASAREHEFALRAALGGGRGRIARQLLTESVLVALLGGAFGLLMATLGIDVLLAMRPDNLPRGDTVGLNGTVLAFTGATALLAALLFGLVPAARGAAARGSGVLATRGAGHEASRVRLRRTLVASQVALSLVLVVGAGLLLRTFSELQGVDPGFDAKGVVTVDLALPFFEYRSEDRRREFYSEVSRRVAGLPGVEASGGAAALPLSGRTLGSGSVARAEEDAASADAEQAGYRIVMPGFFETLRTPLLSGRSFDAGDSRTGAEPVVVVDGRLAARLWPEGEALGQSLWVGAPGPDQQNVPVQTRVIGVVQPMRDADLRADGIGTVYLPVGLNPWFEMSLVVRTRGDARLVAEAVRAEVAAVDRSVPLFRTRSLDDYVADALAPTRFAMTLLGAFAAVAMALAAVGLYGLIATTVQQRTREIGVRMAMGAERDEVLRMVVTQGLRLVAVGLAVGVVAAALVSRVMSSLLFGVAPTDVATFVLAPLALAAVALVACWIPARRAASVDPVQALRTD